MIYSVVLFLLALYLLLLSDYCARLRCEIEQRAVLRALEKNGPLRGLQIKDLVKSHVKSYRMYFILSELEDLGQVRSIDQKPRRVYEITKAGLYRLDTG